MRLSVFDAATLILPPLRAESTFSCAIHFRHCPHKGREERTRRRRISASRVICGSYGGGGASAASGSPGFAGCWPLCASRFRFASSRFGLGLGGARSRMTGARRSSGPGPNRSNGHCAHAGEAASTPTIKERIAATAFATRFVVWRGSIVMDTAAPWSMGLSRRRAKI